jgi:hypothetical protein
MACMKMAICVSPTVFGLGCHKGFASMLYVILSPGFFIVTDDGSGK